MKPSRNPDFTISKKTMRLAIRLIRTPFGPTATKFCYVHVPKCGGNSVALAFINSIPIMRRFTWVPVSETRRAVSLSELGHVDEASFHDDGPNGEKVYALRRNMATVAMDMGHDYVGGHFLFDRRAHDTFSEHYSFVTILRDPVARMISHYQEERRSGFVSASLEDYLDSPMARAQATTITRYMAGWAATTLANDTDAPEMALANVERFAAVGFLENLTPFQKKITKIAGKSFTLGHSRIATVAKPDIDDHTLTRIHEMCRSDIAVFARARRLFAE